MQRCLALAGALRALGWQTEFAFRAGTRETVPVLSQSGHGLLQLQATPESEASELRAHYGDMLDLVIVDHYQRGSQFEQECRSFAAAVMVLDDQPRRPHAADILLDATPRHQSAYAAFVPDDCLMLIGPAYALLRPQFAQAREYALVRRQENAEPRRLLISLGTTDPTNITQGVVEAIARSGLPIEVDIVIGSAAPSLETLRNLASAHDMHLHVDVSDMAGLMAQADIAIGASGASSFERCCLGLPSLIIVTAENQSQFADALVRAGAVERIGGDFQSSELITALRSFMNEPSRRRSMSLRAASLCDGLGAGRAAEAITAHLSRPVKKAINHR